MKLYYHPGACSLADHIALHEAGLKFDHEKVDLKAKKTEHGDDYKTINPKGYVPALRLDDGAILTENVAILDWIAHQSAALKPEGALGHSRQLEALAFISTELHKSFKPFFADADEAQKKAAAELIGKRLQLIADDLEGDYLFGDRFSVADAYLFVMLTWADKFGITKPPELRTYFDRVKAREAVRKALAHEGLD